MQQQVWSARLEWVTGQIGYAVDILDCATAASAGLEGSKGYAVDIPGCVTVGAATGLVGLHISNSNSTVIIGNNTF